MRTILAVRLPGNPRTQSERFSLYWWKGVTPILDESAPYAFNSTHPSLPALHYRIRKGESLVDLAAGFANRYGEPIRLILLDGIGNTTICCEPDF